VYKRKGDAMHTTQKSSTFVLGAANLANILSVNKYIFYEYVQISSSEKLALKVSLEYQQDRINEFTALYIWFI